MGLGMGSYESASVKATITLDYSEFKSGISSCMDELGKLQTAFNEAGNVTSFGKTKAEMDKLSETTKSLQGVAKSLGEVINVISEKFTTLGTSGKNSTTQLNTGLDSTKTSLNSVNNEVTKVKSNLSTLKSGSGLNSVQSEFQGVKGEVTSVNDSVNGLKSNLNTIGKNSGLTSMQTQLGKVKAESEGLTSSILANSTKINSSYQKEAQGVNSVSESLMKKSSITNLVANNAMNSSNQIITATNREKASIMGAIDTTDAAGRAAIRMGTNFTSGLNTALMTMDRTRTTAAQMGSGVGQLTSQMVQFANASSTSFNTFREQAKLGADAFKVFESNVGAGMNLIKMKSQSFVANAIEMGVSLNDLQAIMTRFGFTANTSFSSFTNAARTAASNSTSATAQISMGLQNLERTINGFSGNSRNSIEAYITQSRLMGTTTEQSTTQASAAYGSLEGRITQFQQKSTAEIGKYRASLNELKATNSSLASSTSGLSGNLSRMDGSLQNSTQNVNRLDSAFHLLRRTISLVVVMLGFELITRLGQASAATINARENVKSMAKIMGWSSQEVSKFTQKGEELQKVYSKIDMSQVESQVMGIAQQYKLSSSAATEFIDTAAVFTAAMKTEGRSTEDATLALKDLVDQGTGWARRAQEIGVTEEKLKATHLWSGKEDDTEGLIAALKKVELEMGLVKRAMNINTPEEAVNAMTVAFSNLVADIYEAFSPDITFIIGNVAKGLWALDEAVLSLRGSYNSLSGWQKNLVKVLALGSIGVVAFVFAMSKIIPAAKSAAESIRTFYNILKDHKLIDVAIDKLKEYWGLKDKIDKSDNGTGTGKTKKAPKMEENPYGDLPGKMETYNWKADLKFKMQKIGVNFLAAAVIIAAAMVLITEAILLLILPMTALAAAGMVYKSIEPQVKQGMEAISEMAPVILPLLVAVSALMLVFNKFSVTYTTVGKTALNVGTGIAAALLLVAEAIFMMIPSLLSLAAVGYVYGAVETAVDNGIKGINAVSKALTALAPFLLLFIAATLLVAIPIANVISIGAVAGGIAVGIGLLCEAILGMYPPLLSLAALGNNMPNMAAVNKGTKAIESVSKALQVLSVAMGYILIVDFEVMADAIAKIINAGLGVFDDIGTALDDIKHFITTMNSKSIPQLKGAEAKVKALSEATKILNRLKATLLSLSEATKAIGITNFETDKVVDAVTQIGKMMSGLNKLKITAPDFSGKIQAFNNLKKFFDAMAGAMKSMNQANADTGFNVDMSITTKVQALSNIMSQVNAMKIHAPNFTEKIRAMESLKSFMNSLSSLAKTISQAQANIAGGIDSAKITGAVTSITHIMSTINGMKITAPDFSGKVSALNSLTTFIVPLRSIVGYINNTNVGTDFYTKCTNIGNAMTWIAKLMSTLNKVKVTAPDFSAKITGMNNLKSLVTSMRSVITSIKSMSTQFTNAGKGLGNNLATGLKSAKSNVGAAGKELISQAITSIKNRYATFRSAGHAAGAAAATGLRSGISNMNDIMVTELSSTINEMKSRYSTFYSAGHALGAAAAQGFRDGNQMHSPGIIARSTKQEMDYTLNYLDEAVEPIKAKGTALGQTMATAFTQNSSLNAPSLNTGNIDPSQTASQMSQMMSTQQQYNTQMQQQAVQDSTLINGITANTALTTTGQFNQMSTTIGSSFQQLGLSTQTNLNGIANTNTTYLNKMNANTRTGMTKVQNTTKTNLHQMQSTTTSTVSKMNSAWNNMRGTIVSAAGQIRSQSYAKFSSLHRSISSFYNQLSSAHFTAGLATGPGGNLRGLRIGRRGPHTGGRIRTPSGLSSVTRRTSSSEPSYGTSDFNNRKKSKLYLELLDNPDPLLLEQLRLSSGDPDGYYGTVNSNYQRIKQTVDSYSIADPYFLGIQIPMDNHVRDWDDGRSKRIDASNFESILSLVLTTRGFRNPGSYSYYSDSMKSNQETWDSVSCNCYDGAEMIAEIGRMLVGNGSIVHGSWNGEGHMAAMVNGQIFDMTQFQKHGVFRGTAGVSFGPSPSNTSSVTRNYGRGTNSVTPHPAETTVININFDGATINGEADFAEKMEAIARKIFYKEQGVNPNTGI